MHEPCREQTQYNYFSMNSYKIKKVGYFELGCLALYSF